MNNYEPSTRKKKIHRIFNCIIVRNTVVTQSFWTADSSLWEIAILKNSPLIQKSSYEDFKHIIFICKITPVIFLGIFHSWQRSLKIE
jgi:hypothetical protein